MTEIWKTIPGYEGRYEVSTFGRIRSFQKGVKKPVLNRGGYFIVGLYDSSGRRITKTVHRLVMLTFCGPDARTVNHKDGNKANNRLENLEYMTVKENIQHAHHIGLCSKTFGEKHWRAKLSDAQVVEMAKMERNNIRHKVIAERFGISRETVSIILRRRYANMEALA